MLTAILSLLPTGCKEGELDPSLVKADEMLREGRDLEAWLLLDNQKYAKGKVCEWDYALYCVLRLQAEERNGKLLTDGLAADALEYYKDKDDDGYHAGLAWYFQGWESLLANNYDDALMVLREAKRLMDGEHCLRYQYLSRNYLSAIYSKYNADEDCVRELSEALGYAKQLKNERYMSSTLLNLAKSLRRVGKVDSSLLCLRELIVLGTMKNMKDVVVDEIGLDYMYKGDRANMERIMDSLSVMRKRHSFVVPNVENIIRARIQIDEGDYREAIKRLDEIKKVGSYDVRIARENLYIEAYTGLGDIDEANNHRGSLRMIEGDGGAELEKIKAEAERKYGKIQEYRDENRSGIVREMAKNVGIGVGVLAIVIGVFFVLSRRGRGKKKK